MSTARSLALALPLLGLPALTGCIGVAHRDYSAYEEVIQTVRLEHAEANEAAQTLNAVLAEDDDPAHPSNRSQVRLSVDTRTNSIVLRGPRSQVKELEKVLKDLDIER